MSNKDLEALQKVSVKSFQELKSKAAKLHNSDDFYGKQQITSGCRFRNILPPKLTTVMVNDQPFHANFVGKAGDNGQFIAMQGLMKEGANKQSIPAFYRMLLENNGNRVVNLTNENDGMQKILEDDGSVSKIQNDLAVEYWPKLGERTNFDGVLVETVKIVDRDGYEVITVKVGQEGIYKNTTDKFKELDIFHFTKWPDHGVPKGDNLKKFNQFMNEVNASAVEGSVVVHCKAGVGRTGTFIVLNQLKEGILRGEVTENNLLEKVESLILEGRRARGPQFVQSQSQFELILQEGLTELKRSQDVKVPRQGI